MLDRDNRAFLSPEIAHFRRKVRSSRTKLFALIERLNELAHREMFGTRVKNKDPQQALVAALLSRALTTFQGVVILAEHGLISEATAILRTLLEVLFRIAAIAKDEAVAIAYILEDERHRDKFINKFKMLSETVRSGAGNPEVLESLQAAIRQRIEDQDIRELKTQWFAQRAGLLDFYHSAYSVFSMTVHVNVRDLDGALDADAEGNICGFKYGPTEEGLDEILFTAIESQILCIRAAFSILPIDSQELLDAVHEEFKTLFHRQFAEHET